MSTLRNHPVLTPRNVFAGQKRNFIGFIYLLFGERLCLLVYGMAEAGSSLGYRSETHRARRSEVSEGKARAQRNVRAGPVPPTTSGRIQAFCLFSVLDDPRLFG